MKGWHVILFIVMLGGAFFLGRNNNSSSTNATKYVENQLIKTKDSLRTAESVIIHKDSLISDSEKRDSLHHLDMQEQEYRIQRRESKNRKLQRQYEELKNTKFNSFPTDSLDRIISNGRERLNNN